MPCSPQSGRCPGELHSILELLVRAPTPAPTSNLSWLSALVEALRAYVKDAQNQLQDQLVEEAVHQHCVQDQQTSLQQAVQLGRGTFGKRLGDVLQQYSCSEIIVPWISWTSIPECCRPPSVLSPALSTFHSEYTPLQGGSDCCPHLLQNQHTALLPIPCTSPTSPMSSKLVNNYKLDTSEDYSSKRLGTLLVWEVPVKVGKWALI